MNPQKSKLSVVIKIKAKQGKEEELAQLLTGAAGLVAKTEPQTLYWFATRESEGTFTINDGFEREEGLQAHFNGQVAAALKAKASELIEGGWEQGVLPNIVQSEVLLAIS